MPMEAVKIAPNQRYIKNMSDRLKADLIKVLCSLLSLYRQGF